nr:hypothetical protein Iba_scaffold39091CG0100 [Ipomoea batatas]GME11476.1 hypothetical protein Iba_scaffold11673CG0050 [Ipomoea batatas]
MSIVNDNSEVKNVKISMRSKLHEAITLVVHNIRWHSNIEKAIKGISLILDITQYSRNNGKRSGSGNVVNSFGLNCVTPGNAVTNRGFLGIGSANKDVEAISGDEDANQSSQPRSVHSVVVGDHHCGQIVGVVNAAVALHRNSQRLIQRIFRGLWKNVDEANIGIDYSDETFALLSEAITLVVHNIGWHSNIEKTIKGISLILDITQYSRNDGKRSGSGNVVNSFRLNSVTPGNAVTNRGFLGIGSANKDVEAICGDEDANQSSQPRSVHSVVVGDHHCGQIVGVNDVALHCSWGYDLQRIVELRV